MELYRRRGDSPNPPPRGWEFAIRVEGRELMNNQVHGSEDALADIACARMAKRDDARVLVGGLGMGFTLAAALRGVGPEGSVTVAELVPAVVKWNRGDLGAASGRPLDDPRTIVYDGDVQDQIKGKHAEWDAILLDVDNGPHGLTRASNDGLYSWEGLEASFKALREGGILGVWSSVEDNGFTRRIERAGFGVEVVHVRARGKKGGHRHLVWLGTRGYDAPQS